MIKFAEELGREVIRRQVGRAGRRVSGSDAMARELHAAGDCKGGSMSAFNYPKGQKLAALLPSIFKKG